MKILRLFPKIVKELVFSKVYNEEKRRYMNVFKRKMEIVFRPYR